MKLKITIIALTFISYVANAQYYSRVSQNAVAISQQQTNNTIMNTTNNVTVNDYNLGLSMIAYEISAFRNSWENKRKREEALSKAQSQINLVKATYTNAECYPEKIIDGWHSIIATDTYNYCSPAKVLIKNNQIVEFVIGNWSLLSYPVVVLSAIKKGKALITIDILGNKDTLELYFTNDIDQPTLVDKPLDSGYISFWCDSSKIKHLYISIDNGENVITNDNIRPKMQPECKSSETFSFPVKPGVHYYKIVSRGSKWWEGNIEAKENMCFIQLINETNSKK